MVSLKRAMGVAIVAAGLGAGTAQAAFINGNVSLSDGFAAGSIGTTTAIINTLNTIQQNSVGFATGCTGDFLNVPNCNTTGGTFTAGTIVLNAPPNNGVYTVGPGPLYTFNALSYTGITRTALSCNNATHLCTDALSFIITGTVTGTGAQSPTTFQGVWTGNGSCVQAAAGGNVCNGQSSASWSISLSALGTQTVPEPATLGLLGLALAGLGLIRRKTQA